MKNENKMLNAALDYAERGIPVFPVMPRDKKPLTKNGFKAATLDYTTICSWWKRWPDANIGIPTGKASGFIVLDIDAHKNGFESLKALEGKYGVFPDTMESVTGKGGRHKFFCYRKEIDIRNSVEMLGAGLDIRGNGGYVVAPPSIHSSGRTYKKLENSIDWPVPAPEWFLALLQTSTKKTAQKGNKKTSASATAQPKLTVLCRGVREGKRNDSLARLAGGLLRFQRGYLDPELVLELLLAWNDARCYPSLSRREVMQVVNSIAGAELNKIKGRKV